MSSNSPEQQGFVVTASGNTVPPKQGEELICEYEETVGSHIPKRICRAKSESERVRKETLQQMQTLKASPARGISQEGDRPQSTRLGLWLRPRAVSWRTPCRTSKVSGGHGSHCAHLQGF